MYDTFGTKHSLFLLALSRYLERKTDLVVELLSRSDSGKQAIEGVFLEAVAVLMDDERVKECLIIPSAVEIAPPDSEVKQLIETYLGRTESAFHLALLRARHECDIANVSEDLSDLAQFFNHSWFGLAFTAKYVSDRAILKDMVQKLLLLLD